MDAPAGSCVFCDRPAVHRHHLSGRTPDKSYLHPDLVAELCHQHHVLVHNDLRTLNLDTPPVDVAGELELVAFALRRLAVFFARLDSYLDSPLPALVAATLISLADTITGQLGLKAAR